MYYLYIEKKRKLHTHKHTHSSGYFLSKIQSVAGYCIQHIRDFERGYQLGKTYQIKPHRTAQHFLLIHVRYNL